MRQIRKNVFETNSSSCHSLVISKDNYGSEHIPAYLNFNADEDYGWICCTFSDRIIAAKCGKFHFYGNEKIDGTFYRRNVLTWNSRNSYI